MQVKQNVLNEIGVGAGLLLKARPTITGSSVTISDDSILGASRGGFTFNPTPSTRSRAIDGLASNTVGIHAVDRYEPTLSGTFITANSDVLLKALGFADNTSNVLTARHKVKSTDYVDIWFIQPRTDGGYILIEIKNAVTTTGTNIKTNDNGETEIPLTLVGNYTLASQDTPPFSITIIPASV